jgi:ferredoxin-NADP reductase
MTESEVDRKPAVWQSARVADIQDRTGRVKSIFLEPEMPRSWLPGQHADVRLTAEDGYTAQRSYSIANVWRQGEPIELAVELLVDGEVSGYFHDIAAVGDRIEIKVPLGYHFVWRETDGPALLIAGGSGVVPLMSMARHHADRKAATPMVLLYSARTWAEVIFAEELVGRLDGADGFACRFALTREAASRDQDFSRRIDVAMLREVIGSRSDIIRNVYICGSDGFVGAAETAALGIGIEPDTIRTERYGS